MSVDMTKYQAIAKENIHNRPAGEGRLAGKVCIVTGAAQGFGKGIAEELYAEGATIIIADMNQALAEQVAAEMGERACAISVNVSNEESVANLVAQTVEKFGGLDIMVANAGVVRSGPIAQFEQKDFEFVTAINYTGLFLCAKYAAIIMQAQKEADPEASYDIISISSKSGLEGSNKNFAYAGSKFGGLDMMVANAGVVRSGPIATFEKKDMEFVTAINYTGLFLCAKYASIDRKSTRLNSSHAT